MTDLPPLKGLLRGNMVKQGLLRVGNDIANLTGTAWRVFYTNGSGQVTELALGASGTALVSGGAAAAPSFVDVATVLDRDVTETEVTGTVTETTVYSYTVAANTLSTNKTLRLWMQGLYLNNVGTKNMIIRAKFGGTVVALRTGNISADADDAMVTFEVWITNVNAANAQRCYGRFGLFSARTATTFANPPSTTDAVAYTHSGNEALAIDTTAAQDVVITVEHETANAISLKCQSVLLELV